MDIDSTNAARGKIQFENKIQQEVKHPDTLEFLREYFIDRIGVMEGKETLSEELVEQGYKPRVQRFAALRMAKACLEISNEVEECGIHLYGDTIDRYLSYDITPIKAEYVQSEEHDKTSNNLMFDIIHAEYNDAKELGDTNNLIDEVDESELSIEGKRAVGYLPKDFDTLNPYQNSETLDVNKLPLAIVTTDENNEPLLNCPNCLSTSIYDLGYSRFSCLDCDTVFKSPLSLGDLLPEDCVFEESEVPDHLKGVEFQYDPDLPHIKGAFINKPVNLVQPTEDAELKELMELLEKTDKN